MKIALVEAELARQEDEVPVGAVIVSGGQIIARAHNRRESDNNALHHAEILAIEQACKVIGGWRLIGCEMYVTLEPCAMCAGAIVNSRLDAVYFGAYDNKAGCCGSVYDLTGDGKFNHKPNVTGGVMIKECGTILSDYFKEKRKKKC